MPNTFKSAVLTLAALTTLCCLCVQPSLSQVTQIPSAAPGSGSGSGTVTSVGVDGTAGQIDVAGTSPITDSGTLTLSLAYNGVNPQTGTTYAILTGDRGKLVTFSNVASVAVSIAQAGSTGFADGWETNTLNTGPGTVTITPATSTIEGAATLVLTTGQSARIISNGTNYRVERNASSISDPGFAVAIVTGTDTLFVSPGISRRGVHSDVFTGGTAVGPSGAGEVYVFIQTDGTVKLAHEEAVTTFGALTNVADFTDQESVPVNGIPIATCIVAANNWVSCVDDRVMLANTPIVAGSAIAVSSASAGVYTIRTRKDSVSSTGTTLSVAATSNDHLVVTNNANPVAITIPEQAGGYGFDFLNLGAGAVTIATDGGTDFYPGGAVSIVLQQYESVSISDDGADGYTIAKFVDKAGTGISKTCAGMACTWATAPIATNPQTGTTYALVTGDFGKLVTLTNGASIVVSIAAAGSTGFADGWETTVLNSGAGTATITPATSTIEGAATLALTTGQGVRIWSNGTNYRAARIGKVASSTAADTAAALSATLTEAYFPALDGDVTTSAGDLTAAIAANAVTMAKTAYTITNPQTGTTYTIVTGDRGKLITHTNGSATADGIAAAGSTGFPDGWQTAVLNSGSGAVTITPTTSTIEGAATLVLTTGQGAIITSNGTNYRATRIGKVAAAILADSATGNAGTATALAADGANCSAGEFPLGMDASGVSQSCTADAGRGLTQYGVVLGGGSGAVPTATAASTTTTQALFATADAPAFRALASGDVGTLGGKVVVTTGAGAPSAACAVPTSTNFALYWDSTNRNTYYCSNNTGPVWQKFLTDGAGNGKSGATQWLGTTSGGAGFTVNDVAGTSILYILPAANGAQGQSLVDTGAATCPTLETAPTACHQLAWIGPGTTTTVLHGNAAGSPAYGAVVSADITDGTIVAADVDSTIEIIVTCEDAGANDTYACNPTVDPAAYVTGRHYRFKAGTVNTGAATINFHAIGAANIVKPVGAITTALADGDIRAGQWVELVYNGTNMQMQSILGNAASGVGDVLGASALTTDHKVVSVSTTDGTLEEIPNQTANYIFSGPTSGGAAAPTFRAAVDADIPAGIARLADPIFTGSLQLPNGGPTIDAAGEIGVDTTTDQLQFYGAAKRALPSIMTASFTIIAPVATDDFLVMKATYGMTILTVKGVMQGSGNVVGHLMECTSAGASCATVDSTADITFDGEEDADDGTLSNPSIDLGDWIQWNTTSVSSTPAFLTITFTYRWTAD